MGALGVRGIYVLLLVDFTWGTALKMSVHLVYLRVLSVNEIIREHRHPNYLPPYLSVSVSG